VIASAAVRRELLDLALPIVGEPSEVRDASWDHGESEVWRVSGPLATVAVKAHRQGRKFDQELTAYRDWLPALAAGGGGSPVSARGWAWVGAPGVRTPRLLAHRVEHPRALVLSWEEGAVLEGARPGRREELGLRERRGRMAGLYNTVTGAGGVSGSAVGGAVAQQIGMPAMFRGVALLMLAVALAAALVMPRLRGAAADAQRAPRPAS